MYTRITQLICKGYPLERKLASAIVTWLVFSLRPLTVQEMAIALKLSVPGFDEDDESNDFEHRVTTTCASLVEIAPIEDSRYDTQVNIFRLIHLSAKEYFLRQKENRDNLVPLDFAGSHLSIAMACVRYLTYHVPAQPLGGTLGARSNPKDLDKHFPLYHYAALQWTRHLETAATSPYSSQRDGSNVPEDSVALLDALRQFLHQKFALMSWIEACYVFQSVPSFGSLTNSSALMTKGLIPFETSEYSREIFENCLKLGQYLENLGVEWGE